MMIVVSIVHNTHPSREFNDDFISIRRMLHISILDGKRVIDVEFQVSR